MRPGAIPAPRCTSTLKSWASTGVDFPVFYSYAYPAPPGFAEAAVEPEAVYFDTKLGEFVLPYETVRRAKDPEGALMAFLQSTYGAAADLGAWDRGVLECAIGIPAKVGDLCHGHPGRDPNGQWL